MTMTNHRHQRHHRRTERHQLNLVSVAMLFLALIGITIGIVGIVVNDSNPFIILPPTALGVWAILTIRS